MRAHLEAVTATLAARGAVVEEVELPALVPALLSAVQVVLRAETAAYHAECFRRHAAEYRPRIRAAIELGFLIPAPLYLKAQQIRREVRRHMAPLFTQVDALLMPPAPGPAPDPSTTGDPVFNALASGLGLPAISIPTGLAPDGLPLGVQLVGAPLAETSLLEAARWVEAVIGPGVAPPEP
jgi:aspartyl-tRNA(Asn)/glutamyl-tRNA(Gln) amidotransferase subunit A